MNKKSGFTLAEVLVTLMIIGVIAAMTIPSLMQSTSQQEYKAAFKKGVSMLNQAVTLNYAIDGKDATDFTASNFFHLMTQRLNVMSSNVGAFELYTADGMYFKAADSVAGASGLTSKPCLVEPADPTTVTTPSNVCSVVQIDVNGMKGPNKASDATTKVYDIFTLAIYPQKALPATAAQSEILYRK